MAATGPWETLQNTPRIVGSRDKLKIMHVNLQGVPGFWRPWPHAEYREDSSDEITTSYYSVDSCRFTTDTSLINPT